MITLQYTSSSGETINLITSNGLVKVGSANFHTWEYGFETTSLQYGVKIDKITKDACTYEAELIFKGISSDTKALIDDYQDIFEYDLSVGAPGTLKWGEWSIECFISSSATEPSENIHGVVKTVSIYCPIPFWRKIKTRYFDAFTPTIVGGLNFPFNFPFNLGGEVNPDHTWETGIKSASDFEMTFYGPATNPQVYINDYPYKVNVTLLSGERCVIDSENHTVVKWAGSVKTNIYNARQFTPSVFEKIPRGTLVMDWTGTFAWNLKLIEKRSEPRWTSS